MKNIELLELEGKIKNPIMEFLLEYDGFLKKEQIDAILSKGASGLDDLRLILKAYNQHHLKYLEIKDYGNVYCMSTVIAALTYLNDETIFDDMLQYLYTPPILIDATWGNDFHEALPIYFAKFSNKIDTLKQVLFDPELIVDTKTILIIGLYSMPTILNKPALNEIIANVLLEYLRFLLAPQNRETQDKVVFNFFHVDDLIDELITGYMDCGGDANHPYIQQAIEDDLFINEDPFVIKDIYNWEIFIFPLRDIYASNEFWTANQEKNKVYHQNMEGKNRKEQDLTKILNYTKLFSKYINHDDKISVQYVDDGRIVHKVKYKEVEDDLMNDKCELI
jgi:hypothetical protein